MKVKYFAIPLSLLTMSIASFAASAALNHENVDTSSTVIASKFSSNYFAIYARVGKGGCESQGMAKTCIPIVNQTSGDVVVNFPVYGISAKVPKGETASFIDDTFLIGSVGVTVQSSDSNKYIFKGTAENKTGISCQSGVCRKNN
ncbi:hypothetical protein D5018_15375 [Parashewanella curva]|uniref:Uncharacterized protein n=1 Tax=Parashewanella curva TaxID=2338552 RepID=A0A3L8PVH6_9GAMM|nr:hypothetical protein [Parashewanella curva]RLV58779.1 hypothetical protein D5018_15375 [Parashewanella curva]